MAGRSRTLGTRGVPRAVREREMLRVARRLFAERGYNGVSVEEVASAADVTKPMVYAYFDSKEGLYLACVEDAVDELVARFEQATPTDLPPDVRVWRGVRAVFDFLDEAPEAWELFQAQIPISGELADAQRRANERIVGRVEGLLVDAAVAGGIDQTVAGESIAPIAHGFVAAVRGAAVWSLRNPDDPRDLQALRLMNFVWKGFEGLLRNDLWLPPPEPPR